MVITMNETRFVEMPKEEKKAKDIIFAVYESLKEKGYNPVNQLVGYIISGDPTYITSYNNARALIGKLERDDILEEILTEYLKNK